ncbi:MULTISPECIES: hypothetical protein [Sphingobacterium]|uniref:Carbamoyl phosphate synthase-like protein n=1 Tax=Sphingobacterium paramultivorum TaxID=2886510 RepID=A0A7G5E5D8_9SPHI|nr:MULTISPECIES: hypothetical protein [Sphingobacterium]MBB1645891.1 hypothetical protein [Sphingobacterium sp. UME9]MCS4166870.1 hypothetical protein [Sphingobacterium sp. BIGb0116]QMV69213.1 hypothetical protein HS960_16795 [Sphingobacterium paramultivorum]WET70225.1 MAG: hypothetical protein P0Y57_03865 [Sphingobacterium sp.]WSO13003.1 hypothetical protein VUL84_16795 [Sphingobacterium paramultivorum]
MKKILITFGTRPLAMRIAKRLGADFEILYASSEDIPELLLASGKYAKIPKGLLPTFAHEILKLSLDQEVDYVLPLGGFELEPLSTAKVLFEEYQISVLVPDKDLLETIPVMENPPADLPYRLLSKGNSLLDSATFERSLDGLFVASDSGEDLALICVSK